MQKVERGQLWVMRIHAWIAGLALLIAAITLETALPVDYGVPSGAAIGAVAILLIYPLLFAPTRAYHALGYAVGSDELRLKRGRWVRVETLVPLERVQHIDVSQGPIERAFGVSRLVLHTAGTMNSLVVLPGLARETSEAIRDEIRQRIRLGQE